jgi:hypothetical protein
MAEAEFPGAQNDILLPWLCSGNSYVALSIRMEQLRHGSPKVSCPGFVRDSSYGILWGSQLQRKVELGKTMPICDVLRRMYVHRIDSYQTVPKDRNNTGIIYPPFKTDQTF